MLRKYFCTHVIHILVWQKIFENKIKSIRSLYEQYIHKNNIIVTTVLGPWKLQGKWWWPTCEEKKKNMQNSTHGLGFRYESWL